MRRSDIRHLGAYAKEFINILDNLKSSKNSYEVFCDWLVLAAASLYSWKRDPAVEQEWRDVAKWYTEDELKKHSELLGIVTMALEDAEEDFLGEVYMRAEFSNARNGQFFTPFNVSHMMSKMMVTPDKSGNPKWRILKINDCCCGAGGMLIAAARSLKESGFDFQRDAYYVAQDIDPKCARMAYIQLSLIGVPATVVCGDSLAPPEKWASYWQRETVGYHLFDMEFRIRAEKMFDVMRDVIPGGTARGSGNLSPDPIRRSAPDEQRQGWLF
jgi:hypothetical protein